MISLKQLHHFWLVGRTGSIQRAAETSGLTPQTISGQIGVLEGALGRRLLRRKGRGIELTEAGKIALRYAERIFGLTEELEAALAHADERPSLPYRLGLLDIVPKSLAALLLEPVLEHRPRLRLSVAEEPLPRLLSELMLGRLDALIADGPPPTQLGHKLQYRLLIESQLALYARADLSLTGPLPQSLDAAPLLLPGEHSATRLALLQLFDEHHVTPHIVGEFDDSALMRTLAENGAGIFPAPAILEPTLCESGVLRCLGSLPDITEHYYLLTLERKWHHPGTQALLHRFAPDHQPEPPLASSDSEVPSVPHP
ncbi:LysR substrate-binding domain-containing protein [Tepidiphilus olei]|uniref:LysR substrate-binding domain-containing protein n=1 Tax=Tepidiphilus olei TaxID=2502184 RepID=UPI00115E5ADE|nr:LysR substrate-binding domain-containing protein [Tepidiphilus olei]